MLMIQITSANKYKYTVFEGVVHLKHCLLVCMYCTWINFSC